MQHSWCRNGHEVGWGELDGETTPFVRCTHGYQLRSDEAKAAVVPCAHSVRECYLLHARVCDDVVFTRPRPAPLALREK